MSSVEAAQKQKQMKMEILRSDDEVAKLLVEWTTISLESIEDIKGNFTESFK